jgi:hypothetical protein
MLGTPQSSTEASSPAISLGIKTKLLVAAAVACPVVASVCWFGYKALFDETIDALSEESRDTAIHSLHSVGKLPPARASLNGLCVMKDYLSTMKLLLKQHGRAQELKVYALWCDLHLRQLPFVTAASVACFDTEF